MRYKDRFTKGRIIWFIIASLLPLAIFALGINKLLGDAIVNSCFLVLFLILPLAYSAGCYFIIFSKRKLYLKIILFILLLGLFLFFFISFVLGGDYEWICHYEGEEALENYAAASEKGDAIPVLSKIGEPSHVEFHDYLLQFAIFRSDADTLICQYSDTDYLIQKNALEDAYTFQTDPIVDDDRICDPIAEIDGYNFRFLEDHADIDWELDYPKRMVLIGLNDTTREIVYVSFYDFDLDYIDSLTDFINEYCGWEHIR